MALDIVVTPDAEAAAAAAAALLADVAAAGGSIVLAGGSTLSALLGVHASHHQGCALKSGWKMSALFMGFTRIFCHPERSEGSLCPNSKDPSLRSG